MRPAVEFVLREPRIGDIGFVIHRHGVLYNREFGWDWTFEALVADVASEFVLKFNPTFDYCRIAEVDGRAVGSSFVVRSDTAGIAKLRLVYVEPEMRGTGVAQALVEDCMRFAREAGYTGMKLWTNDILLAARRLYKRLGFERVSSEPYHGFGHDLVGEIWQRPL